MSLQPTGRATPEAVLAWLVARIAAEVRLDPRMIDPADPFARYGVDSVTAAELSVALEEWVGRSLSPTLFWDEPTLAAIARAAASPS